MLPRDQERREKACNGNYAPHHFGEAKHSRAGDGGNGDDRSYDNKNRREWIAAHHPLAMLADPPGANAVERRAGGYKPSGGLYHRSHRERRDRQLDRNYHGDRRRNRDASNVDSAHGAMQRQESRPQPAGKLKYAKEKSDGARNAMQKHERRDRRIPLAQERIWIEQEAISGDPNDADHDGENEEHHIFRLDRAAFSRQCGWGGHGASVPENQLFSGNAIVALADV